MITLNITLEERRDGSLDFNMEQGGPIRRRYLATALEIAFAKELAAALAGLEIAKVKLTNESVTGIDAGRPRRPQVVARQWIATLR